MNKKIRFCEVCNKDCHVDFSRCNKCIYLDPELAENALKVKAAFKFRKFKKKRLQKKAFKKWMDEVGLKFAKEKNLHLDWEEWKSWSGENKSRLFPNFCFNFPVPFVWEKTSYEYDEWEADPLPSVYAAQFQYDFFKFFDNGKGAIEVAS